MSKLFFLLILFFPICAYAQKGKECGAIMQKAEAAILSQDYTLALTKLRAYKVCDPSKAAQADDKITFVFNEIKKQRDEARRQTEIARVQRARAEAAQKDAERQTHLTQLSALTSNISLLGSENPTLAFRLSCLAYENNPSLENATILNRIASDTTNAMFRSKTIDFLASFAYDDKKNILYGSDSLQMYEFDIIRNQIRPFPFPYDPQGGRLLAVASSAGYTALLKEHTISLYRHADHTEKRIPWSVSDTTAVRWSGDGAYILLSEARGIHILDTLLNEVFGLSTGFVAAFDVSPGMSAVAVSNGNEIQFFDPAKPLSMNIIHEQEVYFLAFSGDGRKLYTSSIRDKRIKKRVLDSNDTLILDGHTGKISSMSFKTAPAGIDTILSLSDDGTGILWTEDGKIIKSLKNKADRTYEAVLSTEGKRAITRTEKGLNFWELQRNPLGIVSTLYPYHEVLDYAKNMVLLQNTSNSFSVVTSDSVKQISLPSELVLFNVSIIDGKDLFLISGNDVFILNIKTGERKVLMQGDHSGLQTTVNAMGDILCWKDSSFFYFNKNGTLIKTGKLSHEMGNVVMPPRKDEMIEVYIDEVWLTDILTGKRKGTWRRDNLRVLGLVGLQFSPSGDYIAGWSRDKAFLFDTAWYLLRTYEHGNVLKVRFSETGDSLYLLGGSAEIRLTLQGLKRSKDIYNLTIADKIRYNVPGVIKEIVAKGDWREFEASVTYFREDYLMSLNETNIEQLNYLASQSHRFFQKSSNYYYLLDTRISYLNGTISFARSKNLKALEEVLQKIVVNLTKEKKLLSAFYDKK